MLAATLPENRRFLSTLSLRRATRNWQKLHELKIFLSTLSLRRATHSNTRNQPGKPISIHALLAESDPGKISSLLPGFANFYPRSPCGERLRQVDRVSITRRFLSTLSLRRATWVLRKVPILGIFLSTLSLRRATSSSRGLAAKKSFLSTLSLRRATYGTAQHT